MRRARRGRRTRRARGRSTLLACGAPRGDARAPRCSAGRPMPEDTARRRASGGRDRKSTRLNSSHTVISYAVFCLKKKKKNKEQTRVAKRIEPLTAEHEY